MSYLRTTWATISDPIFDAVPARLSTSYLPSLDGLRALSVTMVIASHIFLNTVYGDLISARSWVQVFFVISGFLITTLLLKERSRTQDISLERFYIRRLLRIFPVAYLFLGVVVCLNIGFGLQITPLSFASAALYLKNFHCLSGTDWQTGHFWSLAVEEQFYLVFPFILRYNYKLFVRVVIGFILLQPLVNIFAYHGGSNTGFQLALVDVTGRGTTYILWGSLCAILYYKGIIPDALLRRFRFAAPFLLLAVIATEARGILNFPGKETIDLYVNAPLLCAVLLLSLQPGGWFYGFLNNRFVARVGVLSYSLYIWQQLFTHNQPWAHAFPHADSPWINLPALAVTASVSYYCFEKKFLRLKERFEGRRPVFFRPAAAAVGG